MRLTVAMCTYNPDRRTIERALDAIEDQTMSAGAGEVDVIVVDNNSDPPLADRDWFLRFRVRLITEPRPGLTAAREAVIANVDDGVIVFVDDDNVLHQGYLQTALAAFEADGELAVLGGRIVPEYATRPEPWFFEFEERLAIRRHEPGSYVETTAPPFSSRFPVGAGLAVRHDVATMYVEDCRATERIEGRSGRALSSGEDIDLDLFALSLGRKLAVCGNLVLSHVIPPSRTRPEYLERLACANVESSLMLEQKWAPRFGVPVITIFAIPLSQVLAKSVVLSVLGLRSPKRRVNGCTYRSLARARLAMMVSANRHRVRGRAEQRGSARWFRGKHEATVERLRPWEFAAQHPQWHSLAEMWRRLSDLRDGLRVLLEVAREPVASDVASQKALSELWRMNAAELSGRPISEFGFSVYSQSDEDGILLYLFSVIGTTNREVVEICAGDGIECNAANLIVNHGWHALLVDGDSLLVGKAQRFYGRSRRTRVAPPRVVQAWVTRDNVNKIVSENGFTGDIDLVSLDLDGVDYWIWQALTTISPRIVVLEYQDILGPDRSWTVPYSDDFVASDHSMTGAMPNFAGASLSAFVTLARSKGYRLVGVNGHGFNAFFMRNDVGVDEFPEVPANRCFVSPKTVAGIKERFPLVANMPWVEV